MDEGFFYEWLTEIDIQPSSYLWNVLWVRYAPLPK